MRVLALIIDQIVAVPQPHNTTWASPIQTKPKLFQARAADTRLMVCHNNCWAKYIKLHRVVWILYFM